MNLRNLSKDFWEEMKRTWEQASLRDRINLIALTVGIPALAFLSFAIGASQ